MTRIGRRGQSLEFRGRRTPAEMEQVRTALGGTPSLNGEDSVTLDQFVDWIHRSDTGRYRHASEMLTDVDDLIAYGDLVVRTEVDWDEVDAEWDGEVAPIRPVRRAVYDGDADVEVLYDIVETMPHTRAEAAAYDAANRRLARQSGRTVGSVQNVPVRGGTTGSSKKVGRRFVPPRVGVDELIAKSRAIVHHPLCRCPACERTRSRNWREGIGQ